MRLSHAVARAQCAYFGGFRRAHSAAMAPLWSAVEAEP